MPSASVTASLTGTARLAGGNDGADLFYSAIPLGAAVRFDRVNIWYRHEHPKPAL
jgi:hypothetical protein